jgi:NifU-like protein involved in Fe-S cluster formation
VKCATLPWHALRQAIAAGQGGGKTAEVNV